MKGHEESDIIMKHIFYLQSGVKADALPEGYDNFYVVERIQPTSSVEKFSWVGDDIQYKLDALCVELYDVFQEAVFSSQEEFYEHMEMQPQWISRAGLDSDFGMSKDTLAACFSKPIQKEITKFGVTDEKSLSVYQEIDGKKFKYAYVADCQSLINTLQELLLGCHSSIVGFYKHLCSLHEDPAMEGIYYECSLDSRMVFSFLYSFIIQSYSVFDLLTKITYEIENLKTCESSYERLASSGRLYGDKGRLKIDKVGTVFEKCKTTSIIENLRNELVHNATWEMNPKIFIRADDGKIVERYIFFPDVTEEGTLQTFKNRRRFFFDGKKVNDELPKLYFDVMKRVHHTLYKLNSNNTIEPKQLTAL